MLTGIIVACLLYLLVFVVLWARVLFTDRRPKVRVVVTPYGKHLHLDAPTRSAAVDAFLRADLELAREGK